MLASLPLWTAALATVMFVALLAASGFALMKCRTRQTAAEPAAEDLDAIKKRLEISDLRYGWLRNMGTAILTVLIAVGGWWVESDKSHRDERLKQAQYEDKAYLDTLKSLGSGNSTERATAVDGLLIAYNAAGDDTSRKCQISRALANRLSLEDDLAARDEIEKAVSLLGTEAIDAAIAANRRSAFMFSRTLGREAAIRFRTRVDRKTLLAVLDELEPDFRKQTRSRFQSTAPRGLYRGIMLPKLDDLLWYTNMSAYPIAVRDANPIPISVIGDQPGQDLTSIFLATVTAGLRSPIPEKVAPAEVENAVAHVEATGHFLADITRKYSGKLAGYDFSGTLFPPTTVLADVDFSGAMMAHVIFDTEVRRVSFRAADLKWSYISSAAEPVDFSGANLDQASIWALGKLHRTSPQSFVGSSYWAATPWDESDMQPYQKRDNEIPPLQSYEEAQRQESACERIALGTRMPCPWSLSGPNQVTLRTYEATPKVVGGHIVNPLRFRNPVRIRAPQSARPSPRVLAVLPKRQSCYQL